MRSRPQLARVLLAAALTGSLVAGCSQQRGEPVVSAPLDVVTPGPPVYDPALEPAAAVMALVPASATTLTVTDDTQLALDLGLGTVTSASPAPDRAKLARLEKTASPRLGKPLLGPMDDDLRTTYGFGQADVDWEAHFSGPEGAGWAIKLRDDVPIAGPKAAVAAGVGALADSTYYPTTQIILLGGTLDPTQSWRAEPDLTALVGQVAAATYVQRGCLPFDTAFGPGLRDQLAPAPASDLAGLATIDAFSVSFGSTLVTVQLGALRSDAFERARLAEHLPDTDPDFGLGFADPVADPGGGRIGYTLGDARLAARATLEQHLPFAVCAG